MWKSVVFCGLFLSCLMPVYNTVIYPHLLWDPRNTFFKSSRYISVEPMSRINIVCPSPALVPIKLLNTIPKEQLYENLWIVDKSSYDACSVDTSKYSNRLVMKCNKPLNMNYYTMVFQQFSASPNGLEFTPGKEYYFIATSDGTEVSLTKTSGGHCTSHSMKMTVYVCLDSNDVKCKESSPTTSAPLVCPTTSPPTTVVPTQPQCSDSNTVVSIYNNTKTVPEITNQTSKIPEILTALQNLEAKLISMETKLDNCTAKSLTCIMPTTPAPPTHSPIQASCQVHYSLGSTTSGIYKIDPDGNGAFEVYCDQTTDGGGWAVFQKRFNGKLTFSDKLWNDYVTGFGNLSGEFWLGLDKIHRLASKPIKLRVDLGAPDGEKRFAAYNGFSIGNGTSKYVLTAGTFTGGTAGDSLTFSNNAKFSTTDQDNDSWGANHCAQYFKGAWWHNTCHKSSLNGVYRNGSHPSSFADGVIWESWKGFTYSLTQTEMKVKP